MPHAAPTPEEEARYAELQQMALDFARAGDTDQLAPMLDAGMPVNLADPKGNTLLMLAAYHGHPDTVRLLLSRGTDVDRRNDRGQTPLGGVAFKGYVDIAELLIAAGAAVDADNGGGSTPLMYAVMFGRTGVAALLRHHHAGMGRRKGLGMLAHCLGGLVRLVRRGRGETREQA